MDTLPRCWWVNGDELFHTWLIMFTFSKQSLPLHFIPGQKSRHCRFNNSKLLQSRLQWHIQLRRRRGRWVHRNECRFGSCSRSSPQQGIRSLQPYIWTSFAPDFERGRLYSAWHPARRGDPVWLPFLWVHAIAGLFLSWTPSIAYSCLIHWTFNIISKSRRRPRRVGRGCNRVSC